MKFAKELEEDLVPEWRAKYFNYKIGKKKIKAVTRALKNANRTPQEGRRTLTSIYSPSQLPFTHFDFNKRSGDAAFDGTPPTNGVPSTWMQPTSTAFPKPVTIADRIPEASDRRQSKTLFALSPPTAIPGHRNDVQIPTPPREDDEDNESESSSGSNNSNMQERIPLQRSASGTTYTQRLRYGSIVGTPPNEVAQEPLPALHLPDPALDPIKVKPRVYGPILVDDPSSQPDVSQSARLSPTQSPSAKQDAHKGKFSSLPNLPKSIFRKSKEAKGKTASSAAKIKRAFTTFVSDSPAVTDAQGEAYKELDARQDDFFNFLDMELDKIEKFYKSKETEASARLTLLREQLHEMRDRRLEDLKAGELVDKGLLDADIPILTNPFPQNGHADHVVKHHFDYSKVFHPPGKVGKTSQIREALASPRQTAKHKATNDRGDYVRKEPPQEKIPYRSARRKLKLALQEFYRGLELLKAYALLNRTAFRKINKKYDKAVMARPPLRYMSEKINNAYFVQSTFVEETLVTIEDLYARYFERGNRKLAVSKLRSNLRQGDHSGVSFRNGLYLALGSGLALSGLLDGIPRLFAEDPVVKTHASYLLQIYAGYFLAVALFLMFIIDCGLWNKYRINYVFVFEFDTRYTFDWRSLAELPCFFTFLNGLFLWINFQYKHDDTMYLYWPVVLVVLTVIIIFLPFKVLYYRARKWFLYSNWRLLLAGLYPVEFRDFYFGDMYCSETYTMSQLEVFFCLYAQGWKDPSQCNSSHSRALGFLTALPAVWRALQCLRRYYDSRNWFPHLANFVKYLFNCLYYMSLSMFRITMTRHMKAFFIAIALVNGVYCSLWDVFMDFSLGNWWSKNFLLRDQLGFRRKRYYYAVVIIDVILRQQWIVYVIFTGDVQHSAAMSFFVALAEVIRRGIWSLFRVENEHCNNVLLFRASRDTPLPYSVAASRRVSLERRGTLATDEPTSPRTALQSLDQVEAQRTGSADLARVYTNRTSISRQSRRNDKSNSSGLRTLYRIGTAITSAHSQDFQKKRRPDVMGSTPASLGMTRAAESSDEENTDTEAANDANRRSVETTRSLNRHRDQNVRQRRGHQDDHEQRDYLNVEGSSGSNNTHRQPPRSPRPEEIERHERDESRLRRAGTDLTDEGLAIQEVRDHIRSAMGPTSRVG